MRYSVACYINVYINILGTAMLVCTDRGTENQHIAALQCQFRRDGAEPFADLQSHRYVKSSSNQVDILPYSFQNIGIAQENVFEFTE